MLRSILKGFELRRGLFRLMLETGKFKECSIGSPGMQELRWLLPLKPGDTLCNKARVESAKLSKSKPDDLSLRPRSKAMYKLLTYSYQMAAKMLLNRYHFVL